MFGRFNRTTRWAAFLTVGTLFQLFGTGCAPNFDLIQTVLLGILAATTLNLTSVA